MTPMDFFLQGAMNDKVHVKKSMNLNQLWDYTKEASSYLEEDEEPCKKVMYSFKERF
jgi:hypothetical protein